MYLGKEKIMIACSHPGKIGDTLYALPTIKKLAEMNEEKIDFYTSDYCKPLKRLFEYQPYIDGFYIPAKYKIKRMDMGVQPWRMPIDLQYYHKVYHLGFRSVPDRPLHKFIAHQTGLGEIGETWYSYRKFNTSDKPYVVVAPRGETTFKQLFVDFVNNFHLDVVIIGGKEDYIGCGWNLCGTDFLETVTWIANSKGFLGLQSSQLALANGFDIPKVAVHDGIHWDMRHVIRSDTNFYPINPTLEEILTLFDL
jgi:ADP-heptose:LPS heptosyltransferase